MSELNPRQHLSDVKRVVVKIGTKSITGDSGRFASVARQVSLQCAAGKQVVLVSSGAIALMPAKSAPESASNGTNGTSFSSSRRHAV